jgi:hypothetical protein
MQASTVDVAEKDELAPGATIGIPGRPARNDGAGSARLGSHPVFCPEHDAPAAR